MGADFIGWRDCLLQAELGQDGFLGKIKLRAYKAVIEERVPEEQREHVQIVVRVSGRPDRELSYGSICDELEAFSLGIPDCATCPLSGGGKPLGCYRYVTYPIDAITETLLFEFFTSEVEEPDSIADQIYRDIASNVDHQAGWYDNRGDEGTLAQLEAPLVHSWTSGAEKHAVDSAQVLAAMFIPLDLPVLVIAYARFWTEFFAFIDEKIAAREHANEIAESRTLPELRNMAVMLFSAVQGAHEQGWTVAVDG